MTCHQHYNEIMLNKRCWGPAILEMLSYASGSGLIKYCLEEILWHGLCVIGVIVG